MWHVLASQLLAAGVFCHGERCMLVYVRVYHNWYLRTRIVAFMSVVDTKRRGGDDKSPSVTVHSSFTIFFWGANRTQYVRLFARIRNAADAVKRKHLDDDGDDDKNEDEDSDDDDSTEGAIQLGSRRRSTTRSKTYCWWRRKASWTLGHITSDNSSGRWNNLLSSSSALIGYPCPKSHFGSGWQGQHGMWDPATHDFLQKLHEQHISRSVEK